MMNSHLKRLALSTAFAIAAFAAIPQAGAQVPSGEVSYGQSVVEPTYNGMDGSFSFLLTPNHRHLNPNAPLAEIYLIMYPTDVKDTIGTVICAHQPRTAADHGRCWPPRRAMSPVCERRGDAQPSPTCRRRWSGWRRVEVAGCR
jgi:hypothetical protein